jgi:hypothetical protein
MVTAVASSHRADAKNQQKPMQGPVKRIEYLQHRTRK